MAEKEERVALVTGTTGIGRATTLRLARDGVRVMALGIDASGNAALAATALAEGLQVETRLTDVSQPEEVATAVAETDRETFARCLAVNVGGVHLTAHFGVPVMRRRGGGVIVNLSSVQGHACQAGVAAYVASKGAIHAMTRAMALDFAPSRIRVLSVSPGSVRSPILEQSARRFDGPDADLEAAFARFGAAHPLGRIGEPEEVAELIAFLASDKAAFMTGEDIRIDGGLTAALGVR
jgi:meso-butanediol dehydrogenase/(S,S)-butanediol dehydrogenase/diacetyl reductase